MTEENGAAAPTDVPAADSAPAESKPATQTQEQPNQEAAPENAETAKVEDQGDTDSEDSEPRKLSRNQRLQRKAARLASLVAEQQARIEEYERAKSSGVAADDAPKAADYPQGEWDPGYLSDLAAHKAAAKIAKTLSDRDKVRDSEKIIAARHEAVDEFEERAAEFKASVPDFDATIDALAKALPNGLAPHLIEELQESDKGPAILYQLAKQPRKVADLNSMSPREVAREIGRLEGNVSLPNHKKQTAAPAPLNQLKGGAAPSRSEAELAKGEDVSELLKIWREKKKKGA